VMLYGRLWVRKAWIRWYLRSNRLLSFLITRHQIQTAKGEVIVTNDGATILKSIQAIHPAAKMASKCVS
jgi:hypothetical protein